MLFFYLLFFPGFFVFCLNIFFKSSKLKQNVFGMEARSRHCIKKVVVTFYRTILTFFTEL